MLGRSDRIHNVLFGVRPVEPVTVRETTWGYVIRSTRPLSTRRSRVEMLDRAGSVLVWLIVVWIWLVPVPEFGNRALLIRAIATAALLLAAYWGISAIRRDGGYEVQVDTDRREVRSWALNRRGERGSPKRTRFEQIGDPVLRRRGADDRRQVLCLRLKDRPEQVPLAVGDEATLLAVHDRLVRDLIPIQNRMAFHISGDVHGRKLARRAFPLLGPDRVMA